MQRMVLSAESELLAVGLHHYPVPIYFRSHITYYTSGYPTVLGRCKETSGFSESNRSILITLFGRLYHLVRQQDFKYEPWIWFVLHCSCTTPATTGS